MIYTVTYNPSLDYYVKVNNIRSGIVNRSYFEQLTVGGKGINVSLALKELGRDTQALGFVAGFTGKAICDKMTEAGLSHDFITVEGQSRINVKIKSNNETDINGSGAELTSRDVTRLCSRLKKELVPGDWVVISGSVPSSLDDTAYAKLLAKFKSMHDVNFVVDASGKLLTNALKYHPFLIKPNLYELCEIFGLNPISVDNKQIAACGRQLQSMGARNVIVSLGSAGSLMVTETQQTIYVRAANGAVVNSVAAGDSMVAGFIHEYLQSGSYFSALNFATASGTACAFTQNLATKAQIEYIESLML